MDDRNYISVFKPRALLGPFEPNTRLANPEKLFEGKVIAPEHLLERSGAIYTTFANGDVVKIVDSKITTLGKFGRLCCKLVFFLVNRMRYNEMHNFLVPGFPQFVCGRPLGLSFDTISNSLIVVDTYYGIFSLNLDNGSQRHLVTEKTLIGTHVRNKEKCNATIGCS